MARCEDARCPKCLHRWASHGVPGTSSYGCSMLMRSMDRQQTDIYEVCGCEFAEGNTVIPREVQIWGD